MEGNGYHKELEKIQAGVDEIKDDLSHSIDKLVLVIESLAKKLDSIDSLSVGLKLIAEKFESWIRVFENLIRVAETVVPIKFVLWILAGVLILMVLLFAGVEGVRALLGAKGIIV